MPESGARRSLGVPQRTIVALLSALALCEVLGNFVPLVRPTGLFGLTLDGDRVVDVAPGRPASRAGIRPGDRIVLGRLDPQERERLLDGTYRPPGTRVTFTVERAGAIRHVGLTSEAVPAAASAWFAPLARLLEGLIFVSIGAALVLLRPTNVTWGFFLLAAGYPIVTFGSLDALLSRAWHDAYACLIGLVLGLTIWGGGVFTARFPTGEADLWGRRYERSLLLGAPLAGALLATGNFYALTAYRLPLLEAYQALTIVCVVGAIAVLAARGPGDRAERARSLWVLVGSVTGLSALALNLMLLSLGVPGFAGSPLAIVLPLALVLLPLSVAYAVLRHRVIDVRFALNRALVYGFFTSALVIAFSLIEFFVGKLESGRLAQYVELGLAVVVGFSFNLVHKKVEDAFERFFFRRQHAAEQRMRRIVAAVPHAEGSATVDDFLTREPMQAYALGSAALFRRGADAAFHRTVALGWPEHALERLPAGDPLIAYLAAERDLIDLDSIHWSAPNLPGGRERPFVALPIAAHNVLIGLAFFGERRNGETLDPDERAMLRQLASAAAAAYDHLDAEAMRLEVAQLRGALGGLRSASARPRA
jgi:hypothetical protein